MDGMGFILTGLFAWAVPLGMEDLSFLTRD